MSVVVDASVVLALVLADYRQDIVVKRLAEWIDDGENLHAPAVLPYEVANVLARQTFAGLLNPAEINDIWSDLEALGLVIHRFSFSEDGPRVASITRDLRRKHATDSAYISLAQHLGAIVWTLDGALARGAADLRLPVQLLV